jgi:hypothetical protein
MILKIKVKKEFMEMLQTMVKLQVVDIVIQEKINKIRGMMVAQMVNSH